MDVVLKAYATLLNYFANSSNIPHNTEIDTEIEEMLLTPIQRINETVNGISDTHPLDRRNMDSLASYINAIWYAYEQRSDIRGAIANNCIEVPYDVIRKTLPYFNIPLNEPIDFELIANISGQLESRIRESL